MSMYLSVFARIIIKNQSFFFSFLQQYSHSSKEQVHVQTNNGKSGSVCFQIILAVNFELKWLMILGVSFHKLIWSLK